MSLCMRESAQVTSHLSLLKPRAQGEPKGQSFEVQHFGMVLLTLLVALVISVLRAKMAADKPTMGVSVGLLVGFLLLAQLLPR